MLYTCVHDSRRSPYGVPDLIVDAHIYYIMATLRGGGRLGKGGELVAGRLCTR